MFPNPSRQGTRRRGGLRSPGFPARAAICSCLLLGVVGCGPVGEAGDAPEAASADEVVSPLTVYVGDEEGIALDCAAVRPVTWEVATSDQVHLPSDAVRRVIREVRPSLSLHPEGAAPLIDYFIEVRVEARTAIVSFEGAALAYLNSAACAQAAHKTPIVRTLVEFPEVDNVIWEIDGEIFDAWDA